MRQLCKQWFLLNIHICVYEVPNGLLYIFLLRSIIKNINSFVSSVYFDVSNMHTSHLGLVNSDYYER